MKNREIRLPTIKGVERYDKILAHRGITIPPL